MNPLWPSGRAVRSRRPRLTSVTRWLLVVAGCTGLELVQPALAADESAPPAETPPAAAVGDTILYPGGGDPSAADRLSGPGRRSPVGWVITAVVLIGAGAWLWIQRRQTGLRGDGRKLIGIEETRSLGNRQFLVVVACDGRRLLLGVSPGRISTLADLDDLPATLPAPTRREEVRA